ncbi:MAG: DUF4405 domain-containing protein [Lachnospiraceae bacterium]|nr:DUF4405 domain-containing protein [Lachnospiraceae bacterium]
MKPKMIAKMTCDIAMTVAILLLMPYEMVGSEAHEWIGLAMILLFLCHHILNFAWIKNVFRGKYTPFRAVQTIVVLALLVCVAGLAVSGVMLSRHVFTFLPIETGKRIARTVHMLGAYWGFVLIGVHLGFHWNMIMNMGKKMIKGESAFRSKVIKGIGVLIALYGAYAFVKRQIGEYMFLITQFVFFDFEEPLILFIMDYIAIMGLFVFLGHYLALTLKKQS